MKKISDLYTIAAWAPYGHTYLRTVRRYAGQSTQGPAEKTRIIHNGDAESDDSPLRRWKHEHHVGCSAGKHPAIVGDNRTTDAAGIEEVNAVAIPKPEKKTASWFNGWAD